MRIEGLAEQKRYEKFEKEFLENFATKSAKVDTVFLHQQIVRTSSGTQAVTAEEINAGLAYMNERFINSNIYFETYDISFIDDDDLWDYVHEESGEVISDRLTTGMVDIFYANSVEIRGISVGGFAGGKRMVTSSAAGTLLTHEMGHIFGLAHTHGRYAFEPPVYSDENVNGFPHQVYVEGAVRYFDEQKDDNDSGVYDCYETGDSVCDTPAEFVLIDDVRCGSSPEYVGNKRDYFGDLFEPELGNEMSYGCDGFLTPGQYARMRYVFDKHLLFLQCLKCRTCDDEFLVNQAENVGKNSLNWAMECSGILNKNSMKEIVFDVEGDILDFGERSFYRLEYDNYSFSSKEGKTIIDGSSVVFRTPHLFQIKSDNLLFKDIHFKNFQKAFGIDYEHENISIIDCIFEDIDWPVIVNVVKDFLYQGNKVINCVNDGLRIATGDNLRINNNNFENIGSRGVVIGPCEDCEIDNNQILNAGFTGIELTDCNNCQVTSNEILDCIEKGINFIGEENRNITVANNDINNCKSGIVFSTPSVDNVKVNVNTIINSILSAIELNNVDGLELSSNIISNNGSTGVGIRTGKDVLLSGNKLSDNGGDGFFFSKVIGIDLIKNIITENTRNGMLFDNCEDILIGGNLESSNTLSSNLGHGISINNSDNFSIMGNAIYCNGGDAFRHVRSDRQYQESPRISSATGLEINGTGIPGLTIEVYGNKDSCNECEFENFIGSTIVDSNGDWSLQVESYTIESGENISAMMHSESETSVLNRCTQAEVQLSCFDNLELNLSNNLCEGSTAILSLNVNGNEISWFLDDEPLADRQQEIEIENGGTYRVIIENDENCQNEAELDIIAIAPPELSLATIEPFCEGDTVSLTAETNVQDVEWFFNENLISGINEVELKITEEGSYSIQATNDEGCITSANIIAEIMDCSTSAIDIADSELIEMYPNPASSWVAIELSESLQSVTYRIFNQQGALVNEGALVSGQNKVRLENMPSGLYKIAIYNDTEVFSGSLIILDK